MVLVLGCFASYRNNGGYGIGPLHTDIEIAGKDTPRIMKSGAKMLRETRSLEQRCSENHKVWSKDAPRIMKSGAKMLQETRRLEQRAISKRKLIQSRQKYEAFCACLLTAMPKEQSALVHAQEIEPISTDIEMATKLKLTVPIPSRTWEAFLSQAIEPSEGGRVKSSLLYEAFCRWWSSRNLDVEFPPSKEFFNICLQISGFSRRKNGRLAFWHGLKLKGI